MTRVNAHFWDWIAKKYSKDPVADQNAYQKKLDLTRKYMLHDMIIAEIGCGTGSTAIAHAPFVKHIHASDIAKNMLDIAREKATDQNITNITFTQKKAEDNSTPDNTYDMVMAHSVLHLLPNKEIVVADIFRTLKPGGIFISSTVCIAHLKLPKIFLPIGNFLGLLPMVQFLSPSDLVACITNAGFTIEQKWQPNADRAIFIVARKPPLE